MVINMDWFSLLFWRNWVSSFTIEFAVMFSKMSHGVVGVLTTELALAKVCQVELGYPQTLCSNLTNHTDIEILVQKEVNMFEMKGRMMTQVPTIIYAIMAGSLSDRFGRKPLMISVMVGQILEGLALLVNTIWFSDLGLEYLWLTNVYSLFGGGAVWYLAVYGWAADVTSVEERSSRMARFDGFEQTAYIVGNALSPILFSYLGYEGAFGWVTSHIFGLQRNIFRAKIFLSCLSLLIILRVVRPTSPVQQSEEEQESLVSKLTDLALGIWRTLLRKRSGRLTLCILLEILTYGLYYISFGGGRLWYLYVRNIHGWSQQEFIPLKVARKSLGITILLIVFPILKRLNISDLNLLIAFNALQAAGFLVASFSRFSVGFLLVGN